MTNNEIVNKIADEVYYAMSCPVSGTQDAGEIRKLITSFIDYPARNKTSWQDFKMPEGGTSDDIRKRVKKLQRYVKDTKKKLGFG